MQIKLQAVSTPQGRKGREFPVAHTQQQDFCPYFHPLKRPVESLHYFPAGGSSMRMGRLRASR